MQRNTFKSLKSLLKLYFFILLSIFRISKILFTSCFFFLFPFHISFFFFSFFFFLYIFFFFFFFFLFLFIFYSINSYFFSSFPFYFSYYYIKRKENPIKYLLPPISTHIKPKSTKTSRRGVNITITL